MRNKKGKFAPVKNVRKSACSTNKLNHAKKMVKKNDVMKMKMKLFLAK